MEPDKSQCAPQECLEFLDWTEVEDSERYHLKESLFSPQPPEYLQLPWTPQFLHQQIPPQVEVPQYHQQPHWQQGQLFYYAYNPGEMQGVLIPAVPNPLCPVLIRPFSIQGDDQGVSLNGGSSMSPSTPDMLSPHCQPDQQQHSLYHPHHHHHHQAGAAAPAGAAPHQQPLVYAAMPPPPPGATYAAAQHPQNVFVSNVTANVNLHPYVPSYAVSAPPPPQSHQQQQVEHEVTRGNRGRNNRSRNVSRHRSTDIDSPPVQPQFVPQFVYPAYYPPVAAPQGHHPNAQNVTGHPLYIHPSYVYQYQPLMYPAAGMQVSAEYQFATGEPGATAPAMQEVPVENAADQQQQPSSYRQNEAIAESVTQNQQQASTDSLPAQNVVATVILNSNIESNQQNTSTKKQNVKASTGGGFLNTHVSIKQNIHSAAVPRQTDAPKKTSQPTVIKVENKTDTNGKVATDEVTKNTTPKSVTVTNESVEPTVPIPEQPQGPAPSQVVNTVKPVQMTAKPPKGAIATIPLASQHTKTPVVTTEKSQVDESELQARVKNMPLMKDTVSPPPTERADVTSNTVNVTQAATSNSRVTVNVVSKSKNDGTNIVSSTVTVESTSTEKQSAPIVQPDVTVNDEPVSEMKKMTPPLKSWASLFSSKQRESGVAPLPIKTPVNPVDDDSPTLPPQPKPLAVVSPMPPKNSVSAQSAERVANIVEVKPQRSDRRNRNEQKSPGSVFLNDPNSYRMGEFLAKYTVDNKTVSLIPRGFTNRSNYCYVNSILQSLMACPPFYNLIRALPTQHTNVFKEKSPTPIIDSMIDLVNEFSPLPAGQRVSRRDRTSAAAAAAQQRGGVEREGLDIVNCGPALEPSCVYRSLNAMVRSATFSVEGCQEDAEEFLGCLLNGLNDEMLELIKLVEDNSAQPPLLNGNAVNGDSAELGDNENEWKVMGPKNKGSITRQTDFGRSPLSDIFRGQLRSRVQRAGDQTTDNVQPFFTLQLEIEKVNSVKEALELLVGRDRVEGMTCSKTQQEVEAWKQVFLEQLPLVLILHLKCVHYERDTCSKIIRNIEFPIDLKIDSKLMSAKIKYTSKQKQYKLFAVVYHDGKEATKGHYITDAYHVGYGGWIRYDDSSVRGVTEAQVLRPRAPRMPYLLYYRRCDTVGNQATVPQTKKDTVNG